MKLSTVVIASFFHLPSHTCIRLECSIPLKRFAFLFNFRVTNRDQGLSSVKFERPVEFTLKRILSR